MADQISDQSTTNLCFDIAGGTERGTSHQANQDTFFISDDQRLLIVTDGYSRSDKTSGAEAGRLAIESIAKQWDSHRAELLHSAEIQEWLQSSIQIANKILYAELMAKDINAFCATTVAVVSDHGSVQIAHVGDVRAYALKHGELKALTEEHTFMNLMKKEDPDKFKMITEQKANICYVPHLMKAVGFSEETTADITTVDLVAGDWLLLCTNGLFDYVSDQSIAQTLSACSCAEEACKILLQAAKEAGAHDDVALVAARCA